MGAPLNPISFRFPFDIQGKAHDDVVSAIRYCFSGLVDINQAIPQLKQQIDAKMTTSQAASPGSSSHSGGGGGGGSTISGLGAVNDQLGVTSYQTQQSDNGAKIIVGDSSAVAVTLDNTVTIPWFTIIDNDSSSVASLSPAAGASLFGPAEIQPGGFGIVYFDGTNFWCGTAGTPIATDSSLGTVQPDGVTIGVNSGAIFTQITVDSGAPASTPSTPGSPFYFDSTASPWHGWVWHGNMWNQFS